jgi:four helix bundle protein
MPLWKESFDLSVEIFNLTVGMPRSEDYGLTSQIRRSATSISANLSEGYGRRTNADKAHFYVIARGSAYETQNHLLYGNKVGYFEQDKMESLFKQYSNLIFSLNKLIKSISSQSQSKFQSQP